MITSKSIDPTGATPAIRPLVPQDMGAVKAVIDATGLFPSALLDAMTAGFFKGEAGDDVWLTYDDGIPIAVAYCAPERMTSGTWNLYLIAVHPDWQGRGVGAALTRHVERALAARDARVLLVETSGLPEFAGARAFYTRLGFVEEARIRDFYRAGEDKVIFREGLTE